VAIRSRVNNTCLRVIKLENREKLELQCTRRRWSDEVVQTDRYTLNAREYAAMGILNDQLIKEKKTIFDTLNIALCFI